MVESQLEAEKNSPLPLWQRERITVRDWTSTAPAAQAAYADAVERAFDAEIDTPKL
jgi:hypothetical protein